MDKYQNYALGTFITVLLICSFLLIGGLSLPFTGDGLIEASATILGASLGAAGAAIAVILSLEYQRKSENEKVTSAVLVEAIEAGLVVIQQFEQLNNFYNQASMILGGALGEMFPEPDKTIYKACAPSIGLIKNSSNLITFYGNARILAQMSSSTGKERRNERLGEMLPTLNAFEGLLIGSIYNVRRFITAHKAPSDDSEILRAGFLKIPEKLLLKPR